MANYQKLTIKKKTLVVFLIAIVIAALSSLELFGVGPDRIQYEGYFNKITKYDFDSRYESGFEYFNIIIKTLFGSGSFPLLVFLLVFLSLFIKFNFYSRRGDWPILILIYSLCILVLYEFIQIRVAFAAAFCMISVAEACKIRSSFTRKSLWFLIALSFHTTSILFIPFIYLNSIFKKSNRFYILIILSLAFLIGFFSKNILISITDGYLEALINFMAKDKAGEQVTIFSIRNIVLLLVMFIGFIRVKDINKNTLPFFYISLLGFVLWFGLLWFPMLAHRTLELTMFSTLVWLPEIKKDYRIIAYISLISFGSHYTYNLLTYFV
jgi:hypothetical protein